MRLCRLAQAVVLAFAAVAAAGQASGWTAEYGTVLTPERGTRLTPGQAVSLRWTSLPPDVDEFEILLSLDGGRHFPVRLTPQLDPSLGVLDWTVPNLPTQWARLRLRWGHGGEEHDGPEGPVFSIATIDGHPMQTTWFRDGEWWLTHPGVPEPLETRRREVGSTSPIVPLDSVISSQGSDDRAVRSGRLWALVETPDLQVPAADARAGEVPREPRVVPQRK